MNSRSITLITAFVVLLLGTSSTAYAARRTRQLPIFTRTSRSAVVSSSSMRSSRSSASAQNGSINNTRWRLRNEQRRADLTTIANAVFSWKRDTGQPLPKAILLDEKIEICRPTSTKCDGMADLSAIFADYLEEVPVDPQAPKNSAGTRYFISKDWKDRFTVWAPDAEEGWVLKKDK